MMKSNVGGEQQHNGVVYHKQVKGPTHWDNCQPIHFLRLEKDRLTVRYRGPGNQPQDVGVSNLILSLIIYVLIH
jgi:hypothetical protein